MKKSEGNGINLSSYDSSSTKKKDFGFQVSENDVSSSVMGGIVEKGFSKLVSEPQVTVLPFPVARHRSHGPHWAPRTSNFKTHDNDDEDGREDEDHTDFNHVAADANPVQRKQKKDLDFKRWRELITSDTAIESHNKEESKIDNRSKPRDFKRKGGSKSEEVKSHEQNMGNLISNGAKSKLENGNQSNIKPNKMSDNLMVEARGKTMASNFGSIESEIDAENRARLERMSNDEIAEAQAEIMNKMNPELLKILQKRGQDKMKKKGSFSSDNSKVIDLKDDKKSISPSMLSENNVSHETAVADSKETPAGLESKDSPEIMSSGSSLWDAWSRNVEAARDIRFSLDGDIINDYAQVPKAGKGDVSGQSFYSGENASDRDFLRTEGDPGAFGYTIKEALALTRSVVSGQRALALHLLASVLHKAQENICQNRMGSTLKIGNHDNPVDWEALWAFALGPEPELALSLRICLDDNHNSVVLACARVIQCVLSYDLNEHFFDVSEKIVNYEKDVCTAPIFRTRPAIDVGFVHGGFWKYNTKPSNILPFDKIMVDDETEGEHTIKDDVIVATQDIAAGLVRMGILPRILYLLESDPSVALEECLISILVALARHSPTCADAIMKCERLIQVIVERFTSKDQMGVNSSKIKSVILLKVLARSDKRRCMEFIENGIFQKLTWHLYRYAFSVDHWLTTEKEMFKLSSSLLVEQLRFWKACIHYGYCVNYFSDLFPALCIWLDVPTFEKLIERNILHEFLAITIESYLVLEALTRTLPNFYKKEEVSMNDTETWCWNHVGPMINLALKWISLDSDPCLSTILSLSKGTHDVELTSVLWVISSVIHMLIGVFKSVIPEDNSSIHGGQLPWLPEFVPKIGLHIIKNRLFSFAQVNESHVSSFLECLCQYRHQMDQETSLASACCLHGLVEIVVLVDKLIQLANTEIKISFTEYQSLSKEDKILKDGILKFSMFEMTTLMTTSMKLTSGQSQLVQSVAMFERGGPAPGVGVGWGTAGGGFWSTNILLIQMDARLLLQLLEIFLVVSAKENPTIETISITMERLNCALDLCLMTGPRDRIVMGNVLDILLQAPVLKCLDFGIRHFLDLNKGLNFTTFGWQYKEEDYLMFSDILTSHFKNRWLHVKKSKAKVKPAKTTKKNKFSLDTIQEDDEETSTSLVMEWAHQRLPLPEHWFLSPILTVDYTKVFDLSIKPDVLNVARSGLFFLLGLEAMSSYLSSDSHSIMSVPVIWKLHALTVTLFASMDILKEEKSRDVYNNLQEFYGQLLDKDLLEMGLNNSVDFLKFDKEIHDSYSTFIEVLVEDFAGASGGDLLYGKQISIYLHRCVGALVRLATWNALSNVRALELLPPLESCLAREEGYLEPAETDEMILEAYVKSWVSGALDRSASKRSVAFTLAVHHLSHFIFRDHTGDEVRLRNKLAKSLLRDYSRKPVHEGMLLKLIQYNKPAFGVLTFKEAEAEDLSLQASVMEQRFTVLTDSCEGNSSLLNVVEKLKHAVG